MEISNEYLPSYLFINIKQIGKYVLSNLLK